jgi:hypothetical protein
LDEEFDAKECIPSFGVCLRRFPEEEVSRVEEKDLSSLFLYLGDKGRFLGDAAKRVSESPTGFDFTHHIVGVDDAELDFGCGLHKRNAELGHDEPNHNRRNDSSIFQFNPPFYSNSNIQ